MKSHTQQEGIQKLKELVEQNNVCLFFINLDTDDGSACSPMYALNVCDRGNIWFLSDKDSHKNSVIKKDNRVQLIFSNPIGNSYFMVNGEAEIRIDKQKTKDLWSPIANKWFKDGKEDPNISIIKVKPQTAYYWDTDSEKMISFFKSESSIENDIVLDT